MGTSEFAVPSLQALLNEKHSIITVVTQPDRPRGRGKKLLPSPVKELALQYNKNIYQPEKINSQSAINCILDTAVDLIVVVSYGQIIPEAIINYPRYGCINVHASLLPAYRGAAPIQRAIMNGEEKTGVTIMYMDKGLDTGDIILQMPINISPEIVHGDLENLLAKKGAELLIKTLELIERGSITRIKQDENHSSYAARLTRDEEMIDWNQSATQIHNKIRALSPLPGAYTLWQGKRLKLFLTKVIDDEYTGKPGEIVAVGNKGIIIKTGKGSIEVLEIQKEGKNKISSLDFARGYQIKAGVVFGNQEVI